MSNINRNITGSIRLIAPGVALVAVIAVAAKYLGDSLPVIGGPVFAILIGAFLRNLIGRPQPIVAGTSFAAKKILQWSIVLIGSGLSLSQVLGTGRQSFLIMIVTLGTAFLAAFLIGRILKVPRKLMLLIGAGTGICGGSAIAAVSPIIEADEMEIAYSMSTIFLFNVLAVILFPELGRLLGFSSQAFGMWAGTAINDTSSVVAAGYAFSNSAGEFATIVKLTRSTMIIPIAFLIAVIVSARKRRVPATAQDSAAPETGSAESAPVAGSFSMARIFPWFILGFLAMSLVHTLHLLPPAATALLVGAGKFMIIMALGAVGLNANFRELAKTGFRPLLLGLVVWASVAASSILIQRLTGFT